MNASKKDPVRALMIGCAFLLSLGHLCQPGQAQAALKIWWDTFEDNNTNGWTISNNGAVISLDATQGNNGTHSLTVAGNSNVNQGATAVSRTVFVDFTRDYTVQCAFKYSDFHWDQFFIFGHVRLLLDYPTLPILYDPIGNCSYVGNRVSQSAFNTYLPQNTWGWITVHVQPAIRQYSVFVDGTFVGTVTYQASVAPSGTFYFEDNHSSSNFLSAWYDDFAVWGYQVPQVFSDPFAGSDPENNAGQGNDPPPVPYHGQYTAPGSPLSEPFCPARPNGRCADACLQMLFDRYGDQLPPLCPGPQEEIECAANTNDRDSWPNGTWAGTTASDIRRGAHFSGASVSGTGLRQGNPPAGQPPAQGLAGYGWRQLGYSVVDSVWRSLAPADSVDTLQAAGARPKTLETFIGSGYPIMAYISPPPDYIGKIKPYPGSEGYVDSTAALPEITAVGHAILLVGYDETGACLGNPWHLDVHPGHRPAFLIHDPAIAKYGWIQMKYFWDRVWTSKRFCFAAPWEQMWLCPNVWYHGASFDGTLFVTYTGAAPLNGVYQVGNAKASLTLANVGLQANEVLAHSLWPAANTAKTGDWTFSTWKLQFDPWPGQQVSGTVQAASWGKLNPAVSSTSYANYADSLGGNGIWTRPLNLQMIVVPPHDPGHWGWPYGDGWWCMGGGGGGGGGLSLGESPLKMRHLGGSTYEVSATIGNFGSEPIPTETVLRFFYADPTVAERAGVGTQFGQLSVPPLAFGDTLTLGPVTWTAPPQNIFGEPSFSVMSGIFCADDPPESAWPQAENNWGALGHYTFNTDTGVPVAMHFLVENPETNPMQVVLHLVREEGTQSWGVVLSLPPETPIPLSPGQALPCQISVTPVGGAGTGGVHVEAFLYTTGGTLLRETGGISMTLHVGTSDVPVGAGVPVFRLEPNQPNPFSTSTTIHYEIPVAGTVHLQIFDVSGRLVRTLAGTQMLPGGHSAIWDGRNASGQTSAGGIYFYRLDLNGNRQSTRRMIHLR